MKNLFLLIIAGLALAGCASPPPPAPEDPQVVALKMIILEQIARDIAVARANRGTMPQ